MTMITPKPPPPALDATLTQGEHQALLNSDWLPPCAARPNRVLEMVLPDGRVVEGWVITHLRSVRQMFFFWDTPGFVPGVIGNETRVYPSAIREAAT
jgi:hypothetical protein